MRAILLGLMSAGCSDQLLTAEGASPAPPEAQITSHADGELVLAGEWLTLRGLFGDDDSPPEELVVTWSVDDQIVGEWFEPQGTTTEITVEAPEGLFVAALQVQDADGGEARDEVALDGIIDGGGEGAPPAVTLSAPADGATFAAGEAVTFAASVSDPDEPPTDLALAWTSSLDGLISEQGADSAGLAQFTYSGLTSGEHTLTVTVTDGGGAWASDLVVFSVSGPPADPQVRITPSPAYTADDLVAEVLNPEHGVDYGYAWAVDGAALTLEGETVSAARTARGELWAVSVVASRGGESSAPGEASATIANSPPTIDAASLAPADPTTDEVLVVSVEEGAARDDDGDAVTLTYAWTVDGAAAGAGETTLDGVDWFDAGALVAVEVTPSDGIDDGDPARAEVTVQNSAPGAPHVVISPAAPIEGEDDLLCEIVGAAADPDADALSYSFTWSVDGADYPGADTGGWSGPGSTAYADDTVPADDLRAGETWTCEVVADDGALSGPAGSDAVTVAEAAPSDCPDGDCALRFDGVDDYVAVPHDVTLDGGADPLTVEAWIYYDQIASGCMTHVRKGTASSSTYDYWHHKNVSPDDSLYWGSWSGYTVVTFSAVSPLAWFHYAGVYDPSAGEARTYLNGVLAEVGSIYGASTANTDDLRVGIDWDFGCPMDGVIDEVRISSSVRYSADFSPPGPFTADADTMALWHFDEYAGATAYDSSGNGNHGALVGPAWTTESP